MKNNWLSFNFQQLSEKIKNSSIDEKIKNKFNSIMFDIYETIVMFEADEKQDIKDKQAIYDAIKRIDEAVDLAQSKHFDNFFKKSI